MTAAEQLIIFVKAPRPGAVKTRLAQTIGAEAACAAYRQLIGILLRELAPLVHVELRFTPDDAAAEIAAWRRPAWPITPQGEGDLGQRMQAAFQAAFATGTERVVLIGSDCPSVTGRDIEEAWSALRQADAVFGPATDGGYWLVGLRAPQPALFRDMAWSTPEVLAETLRRAQAAQLRVQLLRPLTDVDTETDWNEFLNCGNKSAESGPS